MMTASKPVSVMVAALLVGACATPVCGAHAASVDTAGSPRPIAPLSTATVTSRRPTLRWALGAGMDGAHVDLCRDRACTMIITTIDATGTSAAPTSDLPTGVVFWRFFSRMGAVTSATPSPTWQFTVGARSAPIDTSWGTTLDVDGDGYADVAIGAPDAASYRGRAYVYVGGASGVGTTPATSLTGPDADGAQDEFGETVASAGDVNGDGFADLAIATNYGSDGRTYIYLGGASGLATAPATRLTYPGCADGFLVDSVASAGDVNGDGYADLALGAYESGRIGRVYIYLGSASGLGATPTASLTDQGGVDGLFGGAVASAGDVNGDGYGDVAVGAPGASSTGRAYLYLGSASGLGTTPATSLTNPAAAHPSFGWSVACAGDVNDDGFADLAVGGGGLAHVYLGSASGLETVPATSLIGPDGVATEFGGSIASAGDVNGDGFSDLVVGARDRCSSGRAYVYLGGVSGLGTAPATSFIGPDAADSQFGRSVAGAGDVNGDGHADVVVGAPFASPSGRAYVYLGSASGLGSTPAANLAGSGLGTGFGISVY